MTLVGLLPKVLLVLGLGFLVANIRAAIDLSRWARRKSSALAVWLPPKPPFYAVNVAIGGAMGCLLLSALFIPRSAAALFGEAMMFVYYALVVPASARIGRGLYADGIWAESGFMPYDQIGGLRWQEGESTILVIASRLRSLARRLPVPGPRLGEVRQLLRQKIAEHAIAIDAGPGIHLGGHDARDDV